MKYIIVCILVFFLGSPFIDIVSATTPKKTQTILKTTKKSSKKIEIKAKKSTPKKTTCDPNYSWCVPIASDVDCAGWTGNGPAYVAGPIYVIGRDIYGLDRDKNGIACE